MNEESIQFLATVLDLLRQDSRRHTEQHYAALSKPRDDLFYLRQFCIVKDAKPGVSSSARVDAKQLTHPPHCL